MEKKILEIITNESYSAYAKCEMIFEGGKAVDFLILETNNAYHDMMKNSKAQVIGKTIRQLENTTEFAADDLISNCAKVFEKNKTSFMQYQHALKKTFFVRVFLIDKKTFFVIIEPYDPYKISYEQLKKEQEIVMNSIAEGILVISKNYEIVSINRSGLDILGYKDEKDVLSKSVFELLFGTKIQNEIDRFNQIINEIPIYNRTTKLLNSDGELLDVSFSIHQRVIGDTPIGYVISFQDISRMLTLEDELEISQHTNSMVMNHIPGMAYRCLIDKDWTMTHVSEGVLELTGYTNSEIENNALVAFNDIIHPEYREELFSEWDRVIKEQGIFEREYMITTKDGKNKWIYEKGRPGYDKDLKAVVLEGIIIDLSKRREKDLEIEHMMYHDQLTGMKNRLYFDHMIEELEKNNTFPVGIMLADLDATKYINDTFGRAVGDQVLTDFGKILLKYEKNGVAVARTGGDEFSILLPNHDSASTYDIMMSINNDINAYDLMIQGVKVELSVSMGFETKKDNQTTIKEIIKYAENYMHRRKVIARSKTNRDALSSIKSTMIANSQETQEHMERMRVIALKVGNKLGLKQMQMDDLYLLAMLHDIGKMGIPSEIINKPGKLTDDEWVIMKTHPMIGYQIANSSNDFKSIAEGILSHHERFDGFGYPNKLKGEDIPLISRIISIVDTYDAITQDRSYRKARTHEEAIIEIQNCSGSQFDPKIVDVFISIFEE